MRALLLVFALAGCKQLFGLDTPQLVDASIDAARACSGDFQCAADLPYCELGTGTCVECLDDTHCIDSTRMTCNSSYECVACETHADCSSSACLPDGTCGDDTNVAYVDPLGSGSTCTRQQPCSMASVALVTGRPYIKLQAPINEALSISNREITFLAEPGTTIGRGTQGVVVQLSGADVTFHDVTIVGNAEHGIHVQNSTLRLFRSGITGCNQNNRYAIEAKDSTVVLSRSRIYDNTGGGIHADSNNSVVITNSFFYRNGNDQSSVGAMDIRIQAGGITQIEMNTIVSNRAQLGQSGGIRCTTPLPIPNNLIVRNFSGGSEQPSNANVDGCMADDALVLTDVTPVKFVQLGPAEWDLHIGPGSIAIDRGVTSAISRDYDDDVRPQGANPDVGADEYRP